MADAEANSGEVGRKVDPLTSTPASTTLSTTALDKARILSQCKKIRTRNTICRVVASLAFIVCLTAMIVFFGVWFGYVEENKDKIQIDNPPPVPDIGCIDTAIIGAGISGVYAAWLLKDSNQSVTIYEQSGRTGGRLLTTVLPSPVPGTRPGPNDVRVELGAYRYNPTVHKRLESLINQLGLEKQDWSADSSVSDRFYLRGVHLREHELNDSAKVPYKLRTNQQGKTPAELQRYILEISVANISKEPIEMVKLDGHMLRNSGVWNVISQYGGNEAFTFLSDTSGYGWLASNGNAASLLPTTGAFHLTTFKTLKNGMEALPTKLLEDFTKVSGKNQIEHEQKLQRIEDYHGGTYRLHFVDGQSRKGYNVCAKKVILTLQKEALKTLAWSPVQQNSWFNQNIHSVRSLPLLKIFMGFDSPWWETNLGISAGRSITDLPIRQVLFHRNNGSSTTGSGSLLIIYCDTIRFWQKLKTGPLFPGRVRAPDGFGVTENIVNEAMRQLKLLFQYPGMPMPYTAGMYDWSTHESRGARIWEPGFNYEYVSSRMIKPFNDKNVFVVGDSFSVRSWINDCIETVDMMKTRFF